MTDKEQKLKELGYDLCKSNENMRKFLTYNKKPYTIYVYYGTGKIVIYPEKGFKTQQDIDDLQIVYNRTQDELRKAGILE